MLPQCLRLPWSAVVPKDTKDTARLDAGHDGRHEAPFRLHSHENYFRGWGHSDCRMSRSVPAPHPAQCYPEVSHTNSRCSISRASLWSLRSATAYRSAGFPTSMMLHEGRL